MKKRHFIFGLLVLLTTAISWAADKFDDVAIIANKKNSIVNVSAADLAKIFRGEKSRDASGRKIVVITREAGSPERAAVLKHIYGMTEQEYQKYFLQATFTGAVQSAPRQLNGAVAARAFIANNPGAVAYIRASDVDDSVAVIRVEGKAPGDDGYNIKIK